MAHDTDDVCLTCKEQLLDDDRRMKCSDCEFSYHLGDCSGIAESTYKSKGDSWHKSWRCPTCRLSSQRGGPSAKQKKDFDLDPALVMVTLATINKKLDTLLTLKETVDGIEHSIQVLSDKYDAVISHMAEHDKELKELRKRVEKVEKNDAKTEVKELRNQVNELEWRSRRQNLEVHGIPMTEKEDVIEKVNNVAKILNVPDLTTCDVVSAHRLASKPDKVPGIIVRFSNQATRDLWFDRRSSLKEAKSDLFLLENLTGHERSLLWSTKEWARVNHYKYVWYRNGNVLVRKADGGRAHVVKNEDDLQKLV